MSESAGRATVSQILNFCFAEGPANRWFVKDPAFDAEVRARLAELHDTAVEGGFDHWTDTAEGSVALCILLDQVPRNLYRGAARAFASDAHARAVTRRALARGFDRTLPQVQRLFLYLPLEHNEDLADQEMSVRLIGGLDEEPAWLEHAVRHRDIIARFGRFPHRNDALGRASTPQELEFLKQPDSSF